MGVCVCLMLQVMYCILKYKPNKQNVMRFLFSRLYIFVYDFVIVIW